jgi:hypothetical protein
VVAVPLLPEGRVMHTVEFACKRNPRAAGTAGGLTDTYVGGIGMAKLTPERLRYLNGLADQELLPCTLCKEVKPFADFAYEASAAPYRQKHRSWCRGCVNLMMRRVYDRHADDVRARSRERARQAKLGVIAAYGGSCVCCGETHPAFLTLDHINGGGTQLRKSGAMKSGKSLYEQLKREGYPKGELQLLCMNCNFAKGHWGYCPHERGEACGLLSGDAIGADPRS